MGIDWIELSLQAAAMTVVGWYLLALAYVIFTAPLEPPELGAVQGGGCGGKGE